MKTNFTPLKAPRVKNFWCFIFYLVLVSCQNTPSDIPIIKVSEADFYDSLSLGSNTKLTALTAPDSTLIGSVLQIQFSDDRIFLFDDKLHQILIFNRTGELIHKLSASGEGPEEFKFIEAFDIDQTKRQVHLFDSKLFKALTFDFNGQFIKEKKLNFFIRSMTRVRDNWLITNAWSQSSEYNDFVYLFNNDLEPIKGVKKQEFNFSDLVAGASPICINGHRIIFNEPLSNEIFEFDANTQKFNQKYVLDFSPFTLPDPNSFKSIRGFVTELRKNNYKGWLRNPKTLNDGTLIVEFIDYKKDRPSEKRTLVFRDNQTSVYKHLTYKETTIPYPKSAINNSLYSIISSELLEQELYTSNNNSPIIKLKNKVSSDEKNLVAVLIEYNLPKN